MKFLRLHHLLLPCMLTSCMGDLDIKPTETIDQAVAFQSLEDVNAGVLGVYAAISTHSISVNTLLSDEAMWPEENNTGRGTLAFAWQQDGLTSDITAAWANFYQVLDRANRILEAIDNVYTVMSEEEMKSQLKGELLALRAFCHFELLRHYAVDYAPASPGIPVMLESKIGKPARNTVADVYAQINSDLAAAKSLIPAAFSNRNRITSLAVSALQARAALWQQNWDAAITASTEVIDAMPLADRTAFPGIWLDEHNAEVIWKLKREAQDAKLGDFYRNGSNRVLFAPSFKLLSTFDADNDVRFDAYVKNLAPGAPVPRWTVNKYVGGQPAFTNLADVKLFRVAEMYLIRAEAYAAKGTPGLISGAKDLNDLRARRINGYVPQVFAVPAALTDAVMEERFKELAFEGHRYFDLRRKALDIERWPEDVVQAPGALTLTPDDRGYYLPIPLRERQANENISQHPAYE